MEIKDIKTKYELAVYMADRMVDGHDSEVCANIAFQWHKEQVKLFDIPDVVGQSEQILAWERWKIEKGNYPEYTTQEQMIKDYLSQ
jgi:hypothetical protein